MQKCFPWPNLDGRNATPKLNSTPKEFAISRLFQARLKPLAGKFMSAALLTCPVRSSRTLPIKTPPLMNAFRHLFILVGLLELALIPTDRRLG